MNSKFCHENRMKCFVFTECQCNLSVFILNLFLIVYMFSRSVDLQRQEPMLWKESARITQLLSISIYSLIEIPGSYSTTSLIKSLAESDIGSVAATTSLTKSLAESDIGS